MKKNVIILGMFLNLLMVGFSFYAYYFRVSYILLALRFILPGLMGSAALYLRSKQENPFPFFLTSKAHKLRLTRFLGSLVCGSSAIVFFMVPHLFSSFLVGCARALFTGVASTLFWQGYVWPMMQKNKTLFRSAIKLTLFQQLFIFAFAAVFVSILTLLYWAPATLPELPLQRLFKGVIFFISLMAGLGIIFFLGALVNYWLLTMQERTQSILYPALAYGTAGYVVVPVNLLREASHPLVFLSALLIGLAGVGIFIVLYRGSNDR